MSMPQVFIVGAGPVGMTAALGLARYGIRTMIFDEDHVLSEGSRAIAYSSATLAAWERVGAAQAMLAKGVAWSVRHTYYRDRELYTQQFPRPEKGYLPGFFNLQQYYVERFLLDQIERNPFIQICWDHKVSGCRLEMENVLLEVETPQGRQSFQSRFVLASDGARSTLRKILGLPFPGVTHRDRFLIADIRVDLKTPPEPRFFFDHPTNPGQTILIHPQPDGVWRFDWQFGPDVDMRVERDPERLNRRIRALIGDLPFEVVWISDYRFHQRLLDQLRHGNVFFLGDAAHLVAPFGAHGLNSAIADVENLVWKLAFVMKYGAGNALLDTYQIERWPAQQHSQQVTNTTMLFMSPPNAWRRHLRNLILKLSAISPAARKRVNSGKMVEPYRYRQSSILIPDAPGQDAWPNDLPVGGKLPDAACLCWQDGETQPAFLRNLIGPEFLGLYFHSNPLEGKAFIQSACNALPGFPVEFYAVSQQAPEPSFQKNYLWDQSGQIQQIFEAQDGTLYLVRPDGHLAARRRNAAFSELPALLRRAAGMA